MIIQVDWYKETGKWYTGERVYIEPVSWADGIKEAIIENQTVLAKGWENNNEFFVVTSDIPESKADPNYSLFYARLYKPSDFSNL